MFDPDFDPLLEPLEKEPRQALRLRRFFLACAGVGLVLLLLALCAYAGLVELETVAVFFAIAAAGCTVFYALFRSALNLRARDPSLTGPMILASTLAMLYAIRESPEARPLLLLAYLVPFLFGALRLTVKQMLAIAALFLAGYGWILWEDWRVLAGAEAARPMVVQWLAAAALLVWFAFFAGYLSRVRVRLSEARAQLAAALEKAHELVLRDELTGLYTRRHLLEVLERERRRRQRSNVGFCVLMLDLDRFKSINDTYGHAGGDEVLRAFARTVLPLLRPDDVLGRYGGEEFLLVCGETRLEGARTLAERIRHATETMQVPTLPAGFSVTLSIGVAEFGAGEEIEALIARADQALYAAKQRGRNRVELGITAPGGAPEGSGLAGGR